MFGFSAYELDILCDFEISPVFNIEDLTYFRTPVIIHVCSLIFTAKRLTDEMFKEGQSVREFVVSALFEQIVVVMDAHLFLEEDGRVSDG